jgi:CDP-glycerol glycerophosphotransferase (TagB/SpsB family)
MNSRISFSARAVVSDAVKEVWERRGDTSLQRIPIGYCKLDDAIPAEELLPGRYGFFLANGLDPERTTVFFASSWSMPGEAYDLEKKAIIQLLSALCSRNNYNLIVKRHPLEADDALEDLIAGKQHQRIFDHADISLEKAIVWSDIVTTQGSSVVLEALYYCKIPVFLGFGPFKQLILAGMTNSEDVVYFSDFDRFESYVRALLEDPAEREKSERLVRGKVSHILYKTDGRAYLRLYQLAEKLMVKNCQDD